LPRFNYIIGIGREPYPVPPKLVIPNGLVETLKDIGKCSGNITLNEKSSTYNIYVDWFNDFRVKLKEAPRTLVPFAVRLETVALKIAILLEAQLKPTEILSELSVESILTGCAYASRFFNNACSVIEKLSYSSFERLCQRLYDFIVKKPGCTQRDILRTICIPKGAFQDGISYLIESGRVNTKTPSGSRGRPTTYFYPEEER